MGDISSRPTVTGNDAHPWAALSFSTRKFNFRPPVASPLGEGAQKNSKEMRRSFAGRFLQRMRTIFSIDRAEPMPSGHHRFSRGRQSRPPLRRRALQWHARARCEAIKIGMGAATRYRFPSKDVGLDGQQPPRSNVTGRSAWLHDEKFARSPQTDAPLCCMARARFRSFLPADWRREPVACAVSASSRGCVP
jgi:hypothetical protein